MSMSKTIRQSNSTHQRISLTSLLATCPIVTPERKLLAETGERMSRNYRQTSDGPVKMVVKGQVFGKTERMDSNRQELLSSRHRYRRQSDNHHPVENALQFTHFNSSNQTSTVDKHQYHPFNSIKEEDDKLPINPQFSAQLLPHHNPLKQSSALHTYSQWYRTDIGRNSGIKSVMLLNNDLEKLKNIKTIIQPSKPMPSNSSVDFTKRQFYQTNFNAPSLPTNKLPTHARLMSSIEKRSKTAQKNSNRAFNRVGQQELELVKNYNSSQGSLKYQKQLMVIDAKLTPQKLLPPSQPIPAQRLQPIFSSKKSNALYQMSSQEPDQRESGNREQSQKQCFEEIHSCKQQTQLSSLQQGAPVTTAAPHPFLRKGSNLQRQIVINLLKNKLIHEQQYDSKKEYSAKQIRSMIEVYRGVGVPKKQPEPQRDKIVGWERRDAEEEGMKSRVYVSDRSPIRDPHQ